MIIHMAESKKSAKTTSQRPVERKGIVTEVVVPSPQAELVALPLAQRARSVSNAIKKPKKDK